MTSEQVSWVGVITKPGRPLVLTVMMALLIVTSVVLSVLVPSLGSWLFVATAIVAAWWYAFMMRRWKATHHH